MARPALDSNERPESRISPSVNAIIRRAAAFQQTGITSFVVRTALREAVAAIEQSERVTLSERDTLCVLDLLEHPPAPNEKLIAAARDLPPEQ